MPEELITAGSDRAYFQHYCESIYVDDEERIVFPDELAGYTIVPYAEASEKNPWNNSTDGFMEGYRLFILNRRAGNVKKVYCGINEYLKRVYLTDKEFNKNWKELRWRIYERLRDVSEKPFDVMPQEADKWIDFSLLETETRMVSLSRSFQIEYKGKKIDIERQRLISKRASAFDDNKVRYIYSEQEKIIHDKTCSLAKQIGLKEFRTLEQLEKDWAVCNQCRRSVFIRAVIGDDVRRFSVYEQLFNKKNVRTGTLERLARKERIRIALKTEEELHVTCGEDSWIIKEKENGDYKLYHNNYVILDNGERCITSGFHFQGSAPETLNGELVYVEEYRWERHVEKNRKEQEKAISEAENSDSVTEETQKKEKSLWEKAAGVLDRLCKWAAECLRSKK